MRRMLLIVVIFTLIICEWGTALSASEKTTAETSESTPVYATPSPTLPDEKNCSIKGNVNGKGEKIYHCPNWRDYKKTKMNPEEGDTWFCTEGEAKRAGFRAARYAHGVCRP